MSDVPGIGPNMPAPQELKDQLCALLDLAYEVDGIDTERVVVPATEFVSYDENSTEGLTEKQYKITVDCSDPETIRIKIRPTQPPLAWPF